MDFSKLKHAYFQAKKSIFSMPSFSVRRKQERKMKKINDQDLEQFKILPFIFPTRKWHLWGLVRNFHKYFSLKIVDVPPDRGFLR